MIKNIVFDMGRVLIDFDALKVVYQYTDNEEDVKKIEEALFRSQQWQDLDHGLITEEEAMAIVKNRLEEERLKELAQKSFDHWDEYNIWPKVGMKELVADLKKKGVGIYMLTNVSRRFDRFKHMIPSVELFDGILESAKEKMIKPDREIYERLFEKFDLKPEECFFVDDLPANIEGAKACGMDGYCFADGDVEKLRKKLWSIL